MNVDIEQRCKVSEDRGFSSAFWRLIDHETDVSGFVAYGFYKLYKFSEIEKNGITSRDDKALDIFGLHPHLADGFKVRANQFLEEANSNVSTAAAVSAQSKQLGDIGTDARKKNFWSNVGASVTATALIAALPIMLLFSSAEFRKPIGLWLVNSIASLTLDEPTEAIDVFVARLNDHELQDHVQRTVRQFVGNAADPTLVLNSVIDSFDQRPVRDQVIYIHVLEALKRAERPGKMINEIYFGAVLPHTQPAAPPNTSPGIELPLPPEEGAPGFETPLPKQRPSS